MSFTLRETMGLERKARRIAERLPKLLAFDFTYATYPQMDDAPAKIINHKQGTAIFICPCGLHLVFNQASTALTVMQNVAHERGVKTGRCPRCGTAHSVQYQSASNSRLSEKSGWMLVPDRRPEHFHSLRWFSIHFLGRSPETVRTLRFADPFLWEGLQRQISSAPRRYA